jgi:hypothetical protein
MRDIVKYWKRSVIPNQVINKMEKSYVLVPFGINFMHPKLEPTLLQFTARKTTADRGLNGPEAVLVQTPELG